MARVALSFSISQRTLTDSRDLLVIMGLICRTKLFEKDRTGNKDTFSRSHWFITIMDENYFKDLNRECLKSHNNVKMSIDCHFIYWTHGEH